MEIIKEELGVYDPLFTYVIADSREYRSSVPELIKEYLKVVVVKYALPSGDYLISPRCLIERKKGGDFRNSLIAGSDGTNLFDELDRTKRSVQNPLLIIENKKAMFERGYTEAMYAATEAAQLAIMSKMGIPIIYTKHEIDTAKRIVQLAKFQQKKKEFRGIARRVPKEKSLRRKQLFFLEGLDYTGPKKASLIMQKYNSPMSFLNDLINTNILYTKSGKSKGINMGISTKLEKGFGIKYIENNKKMLLGEENSERK